MDRPASSLTSTPSLRHAQTLFSSVDERAWSTFCVLSASAPLHWGRFKHGAPLLRDFVRRTVVARAGEAPELSLFGLRARLDLRSRCTGLGQRWLRRNTAIWSRSTSRATSQSLSDIQSRGSSSATSQGHRPFPVSLAKRCQGRAMPSRNTSARHESEPRNMASETVTVSHVVNDLSVSRGENWRSIVGMVNLP